VAWWIVSTLLVGAFAFVAVQTWRLGRAVARLHAVAEDIRRRVTSGRGWSAPSRPDAG
jgi:hypothetical protein